MRSLSVMNNESLSGFVRKIVRHHDYPINLSTSYICKTHKLICWLTGLGIIFFVFYKHLAKEYKKHIEVHYEKVHFPFNFEVHFNMISFLSVLTCTDKFLLRLV